MFLNEDIDSLTDACDWCGSHTCALALDGFQVLQLLPGGQDRASAPNFGGEQDQHEAAVHADWL